MRVRFNLSSYGPMVLVHFQASGEEVNRPYGFSGAAPVVPLDKEQSIALAECSRTMMIREPSLTTLREPKEGEVLPINYYPAYLRAEQVHFTQGEEEIDALLLRFSIEDVPGYLPTAIISRQEDSANEEFVKFYSALKAMLKSQGALVEAGDEITQRLREVLFPPQTPHSFLSESGPSLF